MESNKKKILFLLGSLEPSKCGVSDYVRLLSNKLINNNYDCFSLAINDQFIKKEKLGTSLKIELLSETSYRLSSQLSWKIRIKSIKRIIAVFKPDIISLQYVPYSFNKKGLPFQLIRLIKSIPKIYTWEIMAHELWVGREEGMVKNALSLCQKFLTIRIIRNIDPLVVHVSNHMHKQQLKSEKIESKILPLFSNITLSMDVQKIKKQSDSWKFVFFGTIQPGWDPKILLKRIDIARNIYNIKSCSFCSIGRCGVYGEQLWKRLRESCQSSHPSFTFTMLGQISEEEISKQLQTSDFGLSRVPSSIVDKSGTVAAMISHGLPIIVDTLSPNNDDLHDQMRKGNKYILMDKDFEQNLGRKRVKSALCDQLTETAKQFSTDLF